MKMKIILVLIFFSLFIFITYVENSKEDINYTILGDKDIFSNNIMSKNFSDLIYDELGNIKDFGFYSKDFIEEDIRIIDLINDVNSNKKIDNLTIQNMLSRTNILILGVGNNEINYKISKLDIKENNDYIMYSYLDQLLIDIQSLINLIKEYEKDNIIFLGYYNDTGNKNNDKYYIYINKQLEKIMKNNDICFINLFNILNKNEDYLTTNLPIYITNDGNIAIFNKIYSKIDELYLHKKH